MKHAYLGKGDEKEKKDEPSIEKEIQESFIKNRKIFLWKAVDDESAERIVKQLVYLDSQNHSEIQFYIKPKKRSPVHFRRDGFGGRRDKCH